ncbi:hypothetical protein [Xenorhabdus santafensis]|nr:hypothetical protein [Xenorhabdus sp. 12]
MTLTTQATTTKKIMRANCLQSETTIMRSGYINSLVTEEQTARAMLT